MIEWNKDTPSQVLMVGMTDCGEQICAASGRISTQEGDAMTILERSRDAEKNSSLIQKVTRFGHQSVLEHVHFNLAFQNVSVLVEQFMIEFRLASFTVKSRRYVDFGSVGYYVPPMETEEQQTAYRRCMDALFANYQALLACGIPKEDARFVLPYCFFSNFYCSLNGRELLHVLGAMLYGRGARYPELRQLGGQLAAQLERAAPGVSASMRQTDPHDTIDLSFLAGACRRTDAPLTELLAATPDAAQVVARTAVLAEKQMSSGMLDAVLQDPSVRARVLDAVFASSRPRPLENAQYTFRLNGLSLPGVTHLVRHRMQAVQIPPLTRARRDAFVTPASVRDNPEALTRYEACFVRAQAFYQEARAGGMAEETLAYSLLSGNTLDVVATMNARELLLFLRLRTCNRAQWEINAYACEMLSTLRKTEPELFNRYGPSCYVQGACPEGRMTCGRMEEVKRQFAPKE